MRKKLALFIAIVLIVSSMNGTVLSYENSDVILDNSEETISGLDDVSDIFEIEEVTEIKKEPNGITSVNETEIFNGEDAFIEIETDIAEFSDETESAGIEVTDNSEEISEDGVIAEQDNVIVEPYTEADQENTPMIISDDDDSTGYQPQNFIGTKFVGIDVSGYIEFYESDSCVYMYIDTDSAHYALFKVTSFDNPDEYTFADLLGNYEYGYQSSSYYYGSSIRGTLNDDGTWSIKWTLSYGTTIYNGRFVEQHTHTYNDPKFAWSEDYNSCIASFSCKAGDNDLTMDCDISSELSGNTTIYTASVTLDEVTYTDTKYVLTPYFNINGDNYVVLGNDPGTVYVDFALVNSDDDIDTELESIVWTSSDPSIAGVELDTSIRLYSTDMTALNVPLYITPYKPGLVTITGTDGYGRTASIDISVEPEMEIIASSVKKGSEITCSIALEDADVEYLEWFMENLSWEQEADTASIVGETSWEVSDDEYIAECTLKITDLSLVSGISGYTTISFISYGGQETSERIKVSLAGSMDYDVPGDEWSFENYSDNPISLTDVDYVALMSNLSETQISYWNGLIASLGNGGVCYGMAVTSVLISRDILPLSTLSSSSSMLYEVTLNKTVQSTIGYYFLNQFTDAAKEAKVSFQAKTVKEQLMTIASMTEPFVLEYGAVGWGSHAVVGYGIEEGDWTYHGTPYTARVLVYDSNRPYTDSQDEGSFLYFNLVTCEWEIPNYYDKGVTSQNEDAFLKRASSNTDIISNFDLELSRDTAHMLINSVEDTQNVQMIVNDSRTYSDITLLNSDEMTLIDYSDGILPDGSGTGVITVDIEDASKCELISEDAENALDVGILYDGYYLTAIADSYGTAAFYEDSVIELTDVTGDFTLGVTADDTSLDYSTIEVSGSDSSGITIELTDDGIVVMSDDLTDLTVTASNDEDSDQITVNSENDSVLIETDDQGNLICRDYVLNSGTCGDSVTWSMHKDGTLYIDGTGAMTDWSSDSDTPWYDYRKSIKTVVIGNGVTTIGDEAFDGCSSLTKFTPGNSLTYIGQHAFLGCQNLKSIEFPSGLAGIGEYAFYECKNLTSVTLPDGLTFIESGAFSYCENLEEIQIPGSVVYLGDETWESETLWCCDTIYGYTNSAAYWYAQKHKISFESVGTLTEGDDYYIAGNMVATGEKGDLIYWILYEDGQLFFCGLGEMEDINAWNSGSTELLHSYLLHSYHTDITSAVFTNGITSIGESTFASGLAGNSYSQFENLLSVKIADSVTSIGDYAFYSCPSLQSVEIGAGVSAIGNCVFSYDYSLSQFIVADNNLSYKSVNNSLFSKDGTVLYRYSFSSETSYMVPDGTEVIAVDAFGDCSSLESITIPVSVTRILQYAFDGCDNLENVYYEGSAPEWAKIEIQSYNTSLENAVLNCAEVTSIEDSACTVNVSDSANVYSGSALTPAVLVSYDDVDLVDGTDYTVSYSNNTEAGTAAATVAGIGNYTGSVTQYFTISKAEQSVTISISASTIYVGDTASISANGIGTITYRTGDAAIADINSDGIISAYKAGSVVITVRAEGDANYEADEITLEIEVVSVSDADDDNFDSSSWDTETESQANNGSEAENQTDSGSENSNEQGDAESGGNITVDETPLNEEPKGSSGRDLVNVQVGSTYSDGSATYTVTSSGDSGKTVTITAVNTIASSTTTSVAIPESVKINGNTYTVTSVADNAFTGNTSIKTVSIGKNVTSIGANAFNGCTSLKTVSGCASVTVIGASAFQGCTALTTVKGMTNVTAVGSKAFYKCTKLTTIGSKSSVITLANVATIGKSAFYGCRCLKKVNLTSKTLTSIGASAFQGCTSLKSFTAKSTKLKSIGKKAFYGDKKMSSVSLKTSKLTKSSVKSNAFKGIKSTCTFKVPSKKVSSYKKIFKARGAGSKIKVKKS